MRLLRDWFRPKDQIRPDSFLHKYEIANFSANHFSQRWSPQGRPWSRGHILKSLASKPQVVGLGLEALGPRKLFCPRLEDSTIF